MKRRDLFKLGAQKTARMAFDYAAGKAASRAGNWLRPPFPVDELDFLLDCTRCDQCIEACAPGVLFKLPARHGLQVAGTPAMDLVHRGCHMCDDWPCVKACEPGVLKLPEADEDSAPALPQPALPKLARVRINPKVCLPYLGPECGACRDSCPVPGALEWRGTKPVINPELCTGCALCREACIVEPNAVDVSAFIPDDEKTAEEERDQTGRGSFGFERRGHA